MSDPLDAVFMTDAERLAAFLKKMPSDLVPLFEEQFQHITRAELVQLRSSDDDKYCPLCTWRGPVELVNGICPQCGVDWPKAYHEYRDALTIAKERIAEQARKLAEARQAIMRCSAYIGSIDYGENTKSYQMCDAWLAANPTPTEDSHQ